MGTRRAWSILGNSQRLDGGAMFGNAPRALWRQWVEPDELNRIPLACRALLVEDGDRRILFETGIGAFFPPQLRDRFGVQEERHVLLDSLQKAGFSHEDVDCVVLSHLHFDHAGGLLHAYDPEEPMRLLFPKATFVVSWDAWQRANAEVREILAQHQPNYIEPSVDAKRGQAPLTTSGIERKEKGHDPFYDVPARPHSLISTKAFSRSSLIHASYRAPSFSW